MNARDFAASASKREALAAALEWALAYEGMSGRPLGQLIDRDDVDWEAEEIPADIVAAALELDRSIRALDRHAAHNATVRSVMREYNVDNATARRALARQKAQASA